MHVKRSYFYLSSTSPFAFYTCSSCFEPSPYFLIRVLIPVLDRFTGRPYFTIKIEKFLVENGTKCISNSAANNNFRFTYYLPIVVGHFKCNLGSGCVLQMPRLLILPKVVMIYILTVKLVKPSTSEIFLECDCVAQKRPIRFEKNKLQCLPRVLNFRSWNISIVIASCIWNAVTWTFIPFLA